MRRPMLVIACALIWACPSAQGQEEAADWQWNLTPYLWVPTIDGHLKYPLPPGGGGGPQVSIGPTDWLDLLNFGALIGSSAMKGRFAVFSDFMFLDMSSKNDGRLVSVEGAITGPGGQVSIPVGADLNVDTRTEVDGLLWTLTAGYAIAQTESAVHHVFAGFRLMSIDVSTSWNLAADVTGPGGETILASEGSVGNKVDLWDGIVGMKGRFSLGEGKWSLPYTLDVGAGDSDLTWSATVSLAHQFNWGDLILGYRHLEYDEGPAGLLQDLSLGGPGVGAGFRF